MSSDITIKIQDSFLVPICKLNNSFFIFLYCLDTPTGSKSGHPSFHVFLNCALINKIRFSVNRKDSHYMSWFAK